MGMLMVVADAVLLVPGDCAEAFPLQAAKTHTERTRSRMIEAGRFHNRARRLQLMPLKTTSILKASSTKLSIDSYAPGWALAATSAVVKHRYRLFCGVASRSDHALRKAPCRGDPTA